MSTDARGRPCVKEATIAGVPNTAKPKRSFGVVSHVVAFGFLLVIAGAALASAIPMPILLLYVAGSCCTFIAYALDKSAAQRGAWRTSERTLHLLALFGGWPGALIAQKQLPHKSSKQPFQTVFWLTVGLNCGGFFWLLTPEGAKAWQAVLSAIA